MNFKIPISRSHLKKFLQFAFAGGVGLIVNLGITYTLTSQAHIWYFWSFLVGTICAWTTSFIINARITFKGAPVSFRAWFHRYVNFIIGYVGFGVVSAFVVYVLTSTLGVPYILSILMATVVTTAGTFTHATVFVFIHPDTQHPFFKMISKHACGILMATCIGIVAIAPFFVFQVSSESKGIMMMGPDAQEHYLARIHEAQLGYFSLGNVFLAQKDVPYLVPGLGEDVMGIVAQVFSFSITTTAFVSIFLYSFLTALLIYALGYSFTNKRMGGLLAASTLIATALINGIGGWKALILGASTQTGFISMSRLVNPSFADVFVFGGILLLYVTVYKKHSLSITRAGLLGLIAGISLYDSFYASSFLFLVYGISFLWLVFTKERVLALRLCGGILLGLATTIPFILHEFLVHQYPAYVDAALRQGVIMTHAPVFSFWLLVLLLLSICACPKEYKAFRTLIFIATLSLCILTEQQIITGHALQMSHYHWYITLPLVGIIGAVYFSWFSERYISKQSYRTGVYILGIVICFYSAILVQISSYKAALPQARTAQSYTPLFSYINSLPDKNPSVFADRTLSLYLPIYTDAAAPNNDYIQYYLVPQSFLVDRLLLEYRLRNILPADAKRTMDAERATISGRLYGVYYRDQFGSYDSIPESLLIEYATTYKSTYNKPLSELFSQLGISYVIAPADSPEATLLELDGIPQISIQNGFAVYKNAD